MGGAIKLSNESTNEQKRTASKNQTRLKLDIPVNDVTSQLVIDTSQNEEYFKR